jgi:hypothetical protein
MRWNTLYTKKYSHSEPSSRTFCITIYILLLLLIWYFETKNQSFGFPTISLPTPISSYSSPIFLSPDPTVPRFLSSVPMTSNAIWLNEVTDITYKKYSHSEPFSRTFCITIYIINMILRNKKSIHFGFPTISLPTPISSYSSPIFLVPDPTVPRFLTFVPTTTPHYQWSNNKLSTEVMIN